MFLLTCVKSGGTPGHRWDPHHAEEGPKSSLLILLFVFFLRPLMHRCIKVRYRDILHIGSYIDCCFFGGSFCSVMIKCILGDFLRISSMLFCTSSLHCFLFYTWLTQCLQRALTLLCMIDSSLCLFSHSFPLQKSSAFYKVSHLCVCDGGGDHSVTFALFVLMTFRSYEVGSSP